MKTWLFFGVCLCLISVPAINGAQEIGPSIDPQADNILRQMSVYIGGFQQFTLHVENNVDTLLPYNQKLQLSRAVDMFVKRPNRFRANIDGDSVNQELGDMLTPGTSALFVLVRKATPDKVLERLKGFKGKVLKTSLTIDKEEELQKILDQSES
jgi:hypothetical protein